MWTVCSSSIVVSEDSRGRGRGLPVFELRAGSRCCGREARARGGLRTTQDKTGRVVSRFATQADSRPEGNSLRDHARNVWRRVVAKEHARQLRQARRAAGRPAHHCLIPAGPRCRRRPGPAPRRPRADPRAGPGVARVGRVDLEHCNVTGPYRVIRVKCYFGDNDKPP